MSTMARLVAGGCQWMTAALTLALTGSPFPGSWVRSGGSRKEAARLWDVWEFTLYATTAPCFPWLSRLFDIYASDLGRFIEWYFLKLWLLSKFWAKALTCESCLCSRLPPEHGGAVHGTLAMCKVATSGEQLQLLIATRWDKLSQQTSLKDQALAASLEQLEPFVLLIASLSRRTEQFFGNIFAHFISNKNE